MGVCCSSNQISSLTTHSASKAEVSTQPNSPLLPPVDIRLELERLFGSSQSLPHLSEFSVPKKHSASPSATFQGKLPTNSQTAFKNKPMTILGDFSPSDLQATGVGISCKKGLKPQTANQDDYSVLLNADFALFSVFDGHGSDGHEVADYVKSDLPNAIAEQPDWKAETFCQTFKQAHARLIQHCALAGVDCELSGTTATVVLCCEDTLTVTHVGDSRAVLGVRSKGRHIAQRLTHDHKPEGRDEAMRIYKSGGEVKKLHGEMAYRVFVKGSDGPGLSVSRAFGDTLAQTVGVTALPEVSLQKLTPEMEYLIICSDGVWEFLNDQEAVDIASRCGTNCKQAAQRITNTARKRWLREEEDMTDDITALVVYLPWAQLKTFND